MRNIAELLRDLAQRVKIDRLRADLAGFATRGIQVVGDNTPANAAGADWTAVTLTALVAE